jgi:adenylate cyclase
MTPTEDPERAALLRLRVRLRAAGVTEAEIAEADRSGALPLLAIQRVVLGAPPLYTREDVAEVTSVAADVGRKLWRAFGFPDVAEGDRVFTDRDVDAVRIVRDHIDAELVDLAAITQLSRVVGSSMARVAEANIDVLRERFEQLGVSSAEAVDVTLTLYSGMREDWDRLFGYAFARHFQAALGRAPFVHGAPGDQHELTLGFADLVAFTVLSQELDEHELIDVVDEFETIAYDTVAGHGGRVVKMIGDEVMFVVDDPAEGARIGLDLAAAYREDESLTDVRIGLAYGPVLAREGDYFGTVVNLASRIVNIAYAGAVVVSDAMHDALADDDEFGWKPLRPRRLKGFGFTPLWVVTGRDEGRPMMTSVAEKVRARRNRRAAHVRPPSSPPVR